jgi:hypothetical protein
MKRKRRRSSWVAFGLFYIALILMVSLLDSVNGVFRLSYWGTQVALITVGVGIFAIVGTYIPDLSAARGVLLAFTVGVLTIIPAVLMGLGDIPGLWLQYSYIAGGLAAGSFLTCIFLKLSPRITGKDQSELERDYFD